MPSLRDATPTHSRETRQRRRRQQRSCQSSLSLQAIPAPCYAAKLLELGKTVNRPVRLLYYRWKALTVTL